MPIFVCAFVYQTILSFTPKHVIKPNVTCYVICVNLLLFFMQQTNTACCEVAAIVSRGSAASVTVQYMRSEESLRSFQNSAFETVKQLIGNE